MSDLRGTTCHAHELFGAWACEPVRLERMVAVINGHSVQDIITMSKAKMPETPGVMHYDVQDGIAVIDVAGPMTKYPSSTQAIFGGTSTLLARRAIRDAVRNDRVRAIMLRVDSPGGTVAGTTDFADEIAAAGTRKPVWSYIEDLGASAAYWSVARSERVIANRNALVGSIGVISVLYDSSAQAEMLGVKVHVVSTGFAKGTGTPGAPVTEEQLADWQRSIDSMFSAFRADVITGRRMTEEEFSVVGTGQVWVAGDAKDMRLIDDVSGFDAALNALRARARKPGT